MKSMEDYLDNLGVYLPNTGVNNCPALGQRDPIHDEAAKNQIGKIAQDQQEQNARMVKFLRLDK